MNAKTLYRASAALLVAAMLTGCGSQAIRPAGLSVATQRAMAAASVEPVDVDKLISHFKSITGFEAAAMNQRYKLIAQMGDSDDDRAVAFLQAEFENLLAFPEAVRPAYEDKLVDALDALDTYEESLDEPLIAAGAGDTAIEAAAYYDALARKKRKKGLISWLTTPFRWVGNGVKKLWTSLTGKKKKAKKRRKPRPAPVTPIDPAPYPEM